MVLWHYIYVYIYIYICVCVYILYIYVYTLYIYINVLVFFLEFRFSLIMDTQTSPINNITNNYFSHQMNSSWKKPQVLQVLLWFLIKQYIYITNIFSNDIVVWYYGIIYINIYVYICIYILYQCILCLLCETEEFLLWFWELSGNFLEYILSSWLKMHFPA